MVESTVALGPRRRQIQAWYICALLHYQGKTDGVDMWAVGLLRRHIATDGLKDRWEFIEGLDWDSAQEILKDVKPRLVRCTAGDLKKVMPNA